MSALKEFREELVTALMRSLGDRVMSTELASTATDQVRAAVATATEGWSVDKRTPSGDDHPLHEGQGRRQYAITTRPRPLTDDERAEVERRTAVANWRYGPDAHRDEPPDGIGIAALLEQKRWWVSKDGRRTRVGDMHPRHRANVLAFLRRNAVELHDGVTSAVMLGGGGMFEPPDEVVDEWVRSLGDRKAADEWLDEQPLIRKLRKLVKADRRAGLLEGS